MELRPISDPEKVVNEEIHLDSAIRQDRAAGKIPAEVVGSAGTVSTGAIDPLQLIAEIARNGFMYRVKIYARLTSS